MRTPQNVVLRCVLPLAGTFALLAACSADGGAATSSSPSSAASSSAAAVSADPALFAKLPAAVQASKTIGVATEGLYPPYEYLDEDGSTVIGLDVELLDAATERLGIDYTLTNTAFDGLLPGLESKRYGMVVAAVSDTKARQAKFDFVDYFQAGQAIVVAKGNPEGIKALADLCGRPVSVLVSSAQEAILQKLNLEDCASKPVQITSLPSDTDALLQVQSQRAEASFTQEPVGRWNASQIAGGHAFEVANSETILPNPLGYVFAKDDTQLRDAFAAALQSLMDDGTYKKILDARELGSGALTEATVDAGTA